MSGVIIVTPVDWYQPPTAASGTDSTEFVAVEDARRLPAGPT
ncbi:hypothetical protein [Reyranella sp.]